MRLTLFLVLLGFCSLLHAQSGAWTDRTNLFYQTNPYEIETYIFEDGSFQLTRGAVRYKFDRNGMQNPALTQEIIEQEVPEEQRSSGCTAFDLKNEVRYRFADNIMHIERLFPDKKNEYKAIPLEKQEHVVKSIWDEYSNNSNHVDAGIVTAIPGKVILYQTYFAISANTHPRQFKPKGINTYLRLSTIDLKDYSVSYEYLLIDVFNKEFGKKKEVLDLFGFKCIGMNSKQELLFTVSKTSFKDRDKPPLTLSDYKTVDYCKSGIELWTVNLNDLSQKKVYSTVIESTLQASSVSLVFGTNGWLLSWTEPKEDGYTFHARSFQVDPDDDVTETVLHFPAQHLKLNQPQTPHIRSFKGWNGERLFCVVSPDSRTLLILDEQANLQVKDNRVLQWDPNKHFVLSESDLMCLPCSVELSAEDLHALSGVPEALSSEGSAHERMLTFRKSGKQVFYVHIECTTKEGKEEPMERIRQLFSRNGRIGM